MDILETLKSCIGEVFGDDIDTSSITENTDIKEDLGLNSIGLLSLAVTCEEQFGFEFLNDDITKIKTVGDVIKIIEERKK